MNAGTYGTCMRWMPPLVVSERRDRRGRAGVRVGAQGHRLSDAAPRLPTRVSALARTAIGGRRADAPHRRRPDATNGTSRSAGSTCSPRCSVSAGGRVRSTSPPRCGCRRRACSRRLDRLEEEGWVKRHRGVDPDRPAGRRGRADPPRSQPVAGDERHLPPRGAAALRDRHGRRRHRGRAPRGRSLTEPTTSSTRRSAQPLSRDRRTSPRSRPRSGR